MMKNSTKIAIGAAAVAVFALVVALVGLSNQPGQITVREKVFGSLTNFQNGVATNWIQQNIDDVAANRVFSTKRSCRITSGSDNCSIRNTDTTRTGEAITWFVEGKWVTSGLSTTTWLRFSMSTSSSALADIPAFPAGWATSTGYTLAPFHRTYASTTPGGLFSGSGEYFYASGTPASATQGFVVSNNVFVHCVVANNWVKTDSAGLLGELEVSTSTNLRLQQECIIEILATTTPSL